jgi:uncharacterized protein
MGMMTFVNLPVKDLGLTDKALAAGAQALGEPEDQGFMSMRGFLDLDGRQWSFIHMDMSAIPEQ